MQRPSTDWARHKTGPHDALGRGHDVEGDPEGAIGDTIEDEVGKTHLARMDRNLSSLPLARDTATAHHRGLTCEAP